MNELRSDAPPLSVDLAHGTHYPIVYRALAGLGTFMCEQIPASKRAFVISDETVWTHYGATIAQVLDASGIDSVPYIVSPGETSKSINVWAQVVQFLLEHRIERHDAVVALGGGVVGDLAGFAAASVLRGVPYVQVPTTIVAMVDSATGGKTGINHPVGKNLIGAFYQPRFVYVDVRTLQTLAAREWYAGLAELIKHAAITSRAFCQRLLEQSLSPERAHDVTSWALLMHEGVNVKVQLVQQDVREHGVRSYLNLGHTFGHAIEKVAGYGTFLHGEAVLIGMRCALRLSKKQFPNADFAPLEALLTQHPVPPYHPSLQVDALVEAMRSDKKVQSGKIRLVLLESLGSPYITADIDDSEITSTWKSEIEAWKAADAPNT